MLNFLAIFLGGGLGAVSRYGISVAMRNYCFDFPFATLVVNVIGSLILGFVVALFWNKMPDSALHDTVKMAVTVGFCGGLTTFSTFSWEAFDLIKNGEMLLAMLYVLLSVLVCILAVSFGVFLSKYV